MSGSTLVHQGSGISLLAGKYAKGNIQEALDGLLSSLKTYRTTFVEHAIWNRIQPGLREGDSITVWTATQNPILTGGNAAVLGIGLNKVRVIQQPTGGALAESWISPLNAMPLCWPGIQAVR